MSPRLRAHPRTDERRPVGPARIGAPRLPPGTIRRRRLIERLAAPAPLTVLRAPTGFGKTVAAAQWLADPAGPPGPAVWLRGEAALVPEAFWSELGSLLVEAGLEPPGGRGPAHRAIEAALRRHEAPVTVVVDDFDELPDPSVEARLLDLVRYCPRLRLVVCLHSSQLFPTSIQVGIATTVIDSADLAFTAEEIARLTPDAGEQAGPAERIRRSTGGWPELTRSVLLALRDDPRQTAAGAALDVSQQFVVERALSAFRHDEWIHFMLTTSLPEALTGRVAEHISGDSLADRRLEKLESTGMLSSSVHRGMRVYRWPEPARRALREELRRRAPRESLALHRRLANQYIREEDPRSALNHALLAHDADLLVRLVEDYWGQYLHDDPAGLDNALAAIPPDTLARSATATAVRDVRAHLLGDAVDDALLGLPDPLPTAPERLGRLARSSRAKSALGAATAMMVAMRLRGRADRALDYADRAAAIGAVAGASQWSDIGPALPAAHLQIGVTRMLCDQTVEAENDLAQAHHASADETRGHTRRDSAGTLALLHALRSDTGSADRWLRRHQAAPATVGALTPTVDHAGLLAEALASIDRLDAERAARTLPLVEHNDVAERSWAAVASYARGRHALIWGDRQSALRQVERDTQRLAAWLGPQSTMGPLLVAVRVDLLLALGHGGRARALLDGVRGHPASQPAAARLALLTGDNDGALLLAQPSHASHGAGRRADLLLTSAVARWRRGEAEAAANLAAQAAAVARESRALAAFALAPRDDLRAIAALVPEVRAVLDTPAVRAVNAPFPPEVTVIELTDRERMVLDRIATDRTMQQIAKELFVSYNTVKTQVRSLYGKLGANSRSAALANAAEHGLLPPVGAGRAPRPAPTPALASS